MLLYYYFGGNEGTDAGMRRYFLFFSSNCYNTDLYDISYATASSVKGPYTKSSSPFKVTGDNGLTAPGGFTALPGGGGLAVCPQSHSFIICKLMASYRSSMLRQMRTLLLVCYTLLLLLGAVPLHLPEHMFILMDYIYWL